MLHLFTFLELQSVLKRARKSQRTNGISFIKRTEGGTETRRRKWFSVQVKPSGLDSLGCDWQTRCVLVKDDPIALESYPFFALQVRSCSFAVRPPWNISSLIKLLLQMANWPYQLMSFHNCKFSKPVLQDIICHSMQVGFFSWSSIFSAVGHRRS